MMTSKVLKKKVIEQRSLKEDTSLGVKFCNTTKEQLFFIRLKRKKEKGGGRSENFGGSNGFRRRGRSSLIEYKSGNHRKSIVNERVVVGILQSLREGLIKFIATVKILRPPPPPGMKND